MIDIKNHFRNLKAMEPIPTGMEAFNDLRENAMKEIKVVIFDVYGTLLISDSGDIGGMRRGAEAMVNVLREFELLKNGRTAGIAENLVQDFIMAIHEEHHRKKEAGIHFPEVDVPQLWAGVLRRHQKELQVSGFSGDFYRQFALAFEFKNNPTYPMPGMRDTLERLHRAGIQLGIVSNAQFFTPWLLQYFMDSPSFLVEDTVPLINEDLCAYSYREGVAKPGPQLYERLVERLAAKGYRPRQALVVGNDRLNDVAAAGETGFRTALFAGDKRSLRLREGNRRAAKHPPNMVITELLQIPEYLNC